MISLILMGWLEMSELFFASSSNVNRIHTKWHNHTLTDKIPIDIITFVLQKKFTEARSWQLRNFIPFFNYIIWILYFRFIFLVCKRQYSFKIIRQALPLLIDPGYLSQNRFVWSSTKYKKQRTKRIYSDKIFAMIF